MSYNESSEPEGSWVLSSRASALADTTGSAKDCNFHPKLLIMVNLVFRYSVARTLIHKMNNYNDYG